MAQNSKIEWCDHTENFWWGCSKKSPACENCYAESMDKMRGPLFDAGKLHWGPGAPRWDKSVTGIRELAHIAGRASAFFDLHGRRQRVFINSMSDTFEDHPQLPPLRARLWAALEACPEVDCLLLTKRPENIRAMVPPAWLVKWPGHVWVGTTVEDQQRADERIPHLLRVPAKVRFLSCEPLLGPVDLRLERLRCNSYDVPNGPVIDSETGGFKWDKSGLPMIHWVICGGESGDKGRPMHPDWALSLRDQCHAAGVPFFFKQWGEWFPGSSDGHSEFLFDYTHGEPDASAALPERFQVHAFDPGSDGTYAEMAKIGKKVAGRLLDGQEWSEFPGDAK